MRYNYTALDLWRASKMEKLKKENAIDFIKRFDEKYPEKTAKEKLINLSKVLGINNLHKTLTGNDIPEDERWEHEA